VADLTGAIVSREAGLQQAFDSQRKEAARGRFVEGLVFFAGVTLTLIGTMLQGPT
jgi:hypothetical protein